MASNTCPICGGATQPGGKHTPFCSARCKDVDLGTWLNEGYKLSRPMTGWDTHNGLDRQEDSDRSDS